MIRFNNVLFTVVAAAGFVMCNNAKASEFELLTGVDVGRYPGFARFVMPMKAPGMPGSGFPGTFSDGDRLAGTIDLDGGTATDVVTFQGSGTPLFPVNHVGATSFLFRRGSIPVGGPNVVPFMGIEFLGGPRLDLDGDNNNGTRSLIPVTGQTPVTIPGSSSFIDLEIDLAGGTANVLNFDATGTNETGPGIQAQVATTLTTIAGTAPDGSLGAPINPAYDNRSGKLTAFTGTSGNLAGVYRIEGLRFEVWNDSIDSNSSSASVLGTLQQFVDANGWLVRRDPVTGNWPTLAGESVGMTVWPAIHTQQIGGVFNTAVPFLVGPTAVIGDGNTQDKFTVQPNGTPISGGDLGLYLDTVISPLIAADAPAFVYIESAGFGINNSFDPVFTDSTGYDLVLIAQARPPVGDIDGDCDVDSDDAARLVDVLINSAGQPTDVLLRADLNHDGQQDGDDVQAFLNALLS